MKQVRILTEEKWIKNEHILFEMLKETWRKSVFCISNSKKWNEIFENRDFQFFKIYSISKNKCFIIFQERDFLKNVLSNFNANSIDQPHFPLFIKDPQVYKRQCCLRSSSYSTICQVRRIDKKYLTISHHRVAVSKIFNKH